MCASSVQPAAASRGRERFELLHERVVAFRRVDLRTRDARVRAAEHFRFLEAQIYGEVRIGLEHAQLANWLAADATRREPHERSVRKLQPRVRDVDSVGEHRHAHRFDSLRLRPERIEDEIQIVDHEIQDHVDLRAARIERGQPMAFREARPNDARANVAPRAVEALDVADAEHDARAARFLGELLAFGDVRGERLLHEQMLARAERGETGDRVLVRGHREHDRVAAVQERARIRGEGNVGRQRVPPRRIDVAGADERNALGLPGAAHVMETHPTESQDAQAQRVHRIYRTIPRRDRSMNARRCSISGDGGSSARIRATACETLRLER